MRLHILGSELSAVDRRFILPSYSFFNCDNNRLRVFDLVTFCQLAFPVSVWNEHAGHTPDGTVQCPIRFEQSLIEKVVFRTYKVVGVEVDSHQTRGGKSQRSTVLGITVLVPPVSPGCRGCC